MSIGQSQSRRFKNKSKIENPVIVDVDADADVDVVIIDAPETSKQGSRRPRVRKRSRAFPASSITILDEEADSDDTLRDVSGNYSSKTSSPLSTNFSSTEGSDSDECLMLIMDRNFPSKSAAKKRVYCKNSQNRFGLYHSSESDSSDCEIVEDSSGNIREQWERASLKKRTMVKDRLANVERFINKGILNPHEEVAVNESPKNAKEGASFSVPIAADFVTGRSAVETSAFVSSGNPTPSPELARDKVEANNLMNKGHSNPYEDVHVNICSSNPRTGKDNGSPSVPTVETVTQKSLLESSALGSADVPLFSSTKTSHDKVDAESARNNLSRCEDIPGERSPSKPNNEKERSRNPINVKEKVFSDVPTSDFITETSPTETSAFKSHAVPIPCSPETTRDKLDATFVPDKIYPDSCTHEPVDPSNSSNGKDTASFNADAPTEEPLMESCTFRSSSYPMSCSSEITSDKVDTKSCTSNMFLSRCINIPVDNKATSSRSGKEHFSSGIPEADMKEKPLPEINDNIYSGVPTTDKLTKESPKKNDVNTSNANTTGGVSVEPGFQNEGSTSEKYSCAAQSTDKTPSDTNVEDLLWVPSFCSSKLQRQKSSTTTFRQKNRVPGEPSSDIESWRKRNVEHNSGFKGNEKSVVEPSVSNSLPIEPERSVESDCFNCSKEVTWREPVSNHHEQNDVTFMVHSTDSKSEHIDVLHESLIGEREKHKESDEYKRAAEEEWASRMQQLQIQAEEAHQLRKKRKAEKQVLDMEKRQKLRLEEIRESQRKDVETLDLKEKLRAEVRKELERIELRNRDMVSLLRGLGIHVEGGACPVSAEVSTAYKKALLKFHPDRSSRMDIRQQVEAEEKFKLISRLKKSSVF